MALGDLKQALAQLEVLKSLAPDEAMVHFLLGRLYKSLREKGLAVRHFTVALNLDPKVISTG
jgi:anaphase-promoting complex subunit 3